MARILALAPDLFFASKITETLRAAGHQVEVKGSVAQVTDSGVADLLIADLDAPGALELPASAPRLGFYSHVDVETRQNAEAAGFDLVVPRSRMAREMPELVARLVRDG